MKFRKINAEPYEDIEKAPFAITSIYRWYFYDGEMYDRFTELTNGDDISFVNQYDWLRFQEQIIKNEKFDEQGNIINSDSLHAYIKSYSNGFLSGYNDLDTEIKEKNSVFNVSNEVIAEFIFSIIHTERFPFSGSYSYYDRTRKKKILRHASLIKSGFAVGRTYKAWFFIISHPNLFEKLFKNYYVEHYKVIEEWLREINGGDAEYHTELKEIIDKAEQQREVTKAEATKFSRTPDYSLLSTDKILKSYNLFKEKALSNITEADYFRLWDLNDLTPPQFLKGDRITDFYYFLSKVDGITIKIALERFGIKYFNSVKAKLKPKIVLINQVNAILTNNKSQVSLNQAI